jgi:uncharacterized membrane protein YdbT with pleckstrin-like domain
MIWEDSPSLMVLTGAAIRNAILGGVIFAVAAEVGTPTALVWATGIVAILLVRLLLRAAALRTTNYRLTSQRLIVESGLFSRASVPLRSSSPG